VDDFADKLSFFFVSLSKDEAEVEAEVEVAIPVANRE
jgi:hypothetical protein